MVAACVLVSELREVEAKLAATEATMPTAEEAVAKVANRVETEGKLFSRIGSGARS